MRRVLIVEDEVLIRIDLAATVEEAGFGTIEASNGEEALDILCREHDIGLVLTDINMSGAIDGCELAASIHDFWPALPVVFTSAQTVIRDEKLRPGERFMPKPCAPACVKQLLHEILGRPRY